MSDKKDPKVEWGYFATTPRVVRTQYKQLSHTEKWLYTCLKDLCGDKGTCYRALRVLAQETDLSTGNLSTGIRHLHEAGLIHAEKKRRNNNPTAKEVWHITIVDIWQSNREYCSKFEHSAENVQEMNNNVQILNDVALKRSYSEQKRSNFVARRNNTEEQHSEEITGEEQQEVASQHFDATPLAPADFLPDETHFFEQETICSQCGNLTDNPDACKSCQLAETKHRIPAIKLNGATHGTSTTDRQHPHTPGRSVDRPATEATPVAIANTLDGTVPPPTAAVRQSYTTSAREASSAPTETLSSHGRNDGAATASWIGSEPAPSGKEVTQASQKPKRTRKKPAEVQLTLQEAQIKTWYEELRETEASFSKRNVTALRSLAKQKGTESKEMFLNVVACLDIDPWFEKNGIAVDLYWIDRQWENKYMFLQRKKPAPLADKKPMDIYTAASLDPARTERNLEKLRQRRLAREAAQQQGGVN